MVNLITTHNAKGEAIFDQTASQDEHELDIPPGKLRFLYATHEDVVDLSSSQDIEQFEKDRHSPFFEGSRRMCPAIGSTTCILSLRPGSDSPMHRTMTIDVVFVLSGKVEAELDSGDKRVLVAGDSIVQRGTMHKWKNVSDDQWATLIVFAQPVKDPINVGELQLSNDWGH